MNSSSNAINRHWYKDKSLFRMMYIITTFFFSVNFFQFVSYGVILLLFVWGIGLLINDVITKNVKKVCLWQYFTAFLVFGVISNLLSIIGGYTSALGIILGFLMLLVTAEFMFLFFGSHTENVEKIKIELYKTAKLLFYITTICNLLGLIMLLVFHHQIILFGQKFIIFENRFTGVYTNPNMAGYNCFVCMICGLILRNRRFSKSLGKGRMRKRFLLPSLVISYVTMVLTASRGAVLILVAFLIAVSCFWIYRAVRTHTIRQTATKIVCFLLIICAMPLLSNLCASVASTVISGDALIEIEAIDPSADEAESELHTDDGMITFEHITGETDGSGRIGLYQKSFHLFSQKPVFGWGCGNVLLMGDKIKTTIHTMLIDFGVGFFETHNGYLTLLSTSGIVGFILFAFCGINIIWTIGKNARASIKKGKKTFLIVVFAFIGAYCCYALVEPTFVYYPSYVCATLWFVLGHGYGIAQDEEGISVFMPNYKKLFNKFKKKNSKIIETTTK